MRVVELDRHSVAERADVAMLLDVAAHEVEQRSGREEILLTQPQFLARGRRVAGVEHFRDRFGPNAVGERADVVARVEGVEPQRVRRARSPKAQGVHVMAAPADDRRVVADRLDRLGRLPDMADLAAGPGDPLDLPPEAEPIIAFPPREFPGSAEAEPNFRRLLP